MRQEKESLGLKSEVNENQLAISDENARVGAPEERTRLFVWILVLCSTISGLLFGNFQCQLVNFGNSDEKIEKVTIRVSFRGRWSQ